MKNWKYGGKKKSKPKNLDAQPEMEILNYL
jgi:hypothetical protein